MFNSNKKNGFTLAETLICLVIIGILSIILLTMVKPADKTTRYLYSNLYRGISEGFYNAMLQRFVAMEPYDTGDPFDSTLERDDTSDEGADVLCRQLVEYINATTDKALCSPTKLTSQVADSFLDENVQFVANNGMKFYISGLIKKEYEDTNETIQFYLVFVDINGDKNPNRLEFVRDDKGKIRIYPDIVAFALLDTAMTVPLGLPEIDGRYMLARVGYQDTDIVLVEPSQPYYIAKNMAWGIYLDDIVEGEPEDPENPPPGVTLDATLAQNTYDPYEPFTMNDIVRSIIDPNSKIQIDVPRGSEIRNNAMYEKCSEQYVFETCSVNIDKYVY